MLERIGEQVVQGRALFMIDVERPEELLSFPEMPSKQFACLLVWDADTVDEGTIAGIADTLLRAGAVYICTWGRGCERVHDIVDEELVGTAESTDGVLPVMTTWHADEPLADALWFLLFAARPDATYSVSCTVSLAVCVGSPSRAEEIRQAFVDPEVFWLPVPL